MKRLYGFVLVFILIMQTPLIGYADENAFKKPLSDIKGHWAEETIKRHYEKGRVSGYTDGTFKPDNNITLAETITLFNKYLGLDQVNENNESETTQNEQWYSVEIARAKYYGYIETLQSRPDDRAERIEVLTMMSLLIDYKEEQAKTHEKNFEDIQSLDDATKELVKKFSELGYISGYEDNTFKPEGMITRAEILAVLDNAVGYIVTSEEDLKTIPQGIKKITIINGNLTLENLETNADIFISPGIDGNIKIKNCKINGQIMISGGTKEQAIQIENTQVKKIVVTKSKEVPKVEIKGKSAIEELKVKTEANIQISGKTIVKEVKTEAKTEIKLEQGTKITNLVIQAETNVDTEKGSKIENLQAKEKTKITGQGQITKAIIENKEVQIERRPAYVKVDDDIGEVKVGGTSISHVNDDDQETSHGNNNDNDDDDDGNIPSDTTAPKWNSGYPSADRISETAIKLSTSLNETGTVYYTVYEAVYGEDDGFTVNELITYSKDRDCQIDINTPNTVVEEVYNNGVASEKSYNIYLVAVDQNNNKQSKVEKIQVAAVVQPDTTAPEITKNAETGDNAGEIKLNASINESGTIYYVVVENGSGAPNAEQIEDGKGADGNTAIKTGSGANFSEELIKGLEEGKSYDIYLVAKDGSGNASAVKSITNVKAYELNHPPLVQDDIGTVDEDSTVIIDILANDTDVNGDVLIIKSFIQGSNGTVMQEGSCLRYTPNQNFNGTDTFTYTVSDHNGETGRAIVTITVNAQNDNPKAEADTVSINENDSILIEVLHNDIDLDGDTLFIEKFTHPLHGTVTNEIYNIRYTPDNEFSGSDSFTYTVSDGNGGTDSTTVSISVNAVNDAPIANNDGVAVDEDGAILINVSGNDTDVEGDIITVVSFTQGGHGTVTQEGDRLRYTPATDFNGSDSFTYDISDGNGGTATGTVNITVNPINDVPVANEDSTTVDEDSTVLIDVLVNDTDIDADTLSITGFTQGSNGTVSQEGDSIRYTPDENYNGADSFTYDISDGNGGTATATVNLTINSVNDVPMATNDSATVEEDSTVLIDVLVNDTDIDADTLSITGFIQGSHGTVTQEGDSLRYIPDAGFSGADSFTYDISDGNGGIGTAAVNITVNAVVVLSMDIQDPDGITDYIAFTINQAGTYEIKSSFYMQPCDTIVAVYTDNTGSNLLAMNDDYVDLYGCVSMHLDPGTYYVQVEDFDLTSLYCHLEVNKL